MTGSRLLWRTVPCLNRPVVLGKKSRTLVLNNNHVDDITARLFHSYHPRHAPYSSASPKTRSAVACSDGSQRTGWLMGVHAQPHGNNAADGVLARTSIGGETEFDGIVVLGGGLRPPEGIIPPWALRRLDGAAFLYTRQSKPCMIAISGGGSPHALPVIGDCGQVVHEGTAYAEYLMHTHGIPPNHILKESSSYDTVGNGFFSAMIHVIPAGWRKVAVVTSDFHMMRARAIFDKVYSLACPSVELTYYPVSDEGLFACDVLQTRKEKEKMSVEIWHRNVGHMTTLAEFHAWLYDTHLCYSVGRQHEFGQKEDVDERLKETY